MPARFSSFNDRFVEGKLHRREAYRDPVVLQMSLHQHQAA